MEEPRQCSACGAPSPAPPELSKEDGQPRAGGETHQRSRWERKGSREISEEQTEENKRREVSRG